VAVSGAAFDAIAATFPVVLETGPFAAVRLVVARDLPFLLVDRLLDVRDEPFLPVAFLDVERPLADRLLEDRFVCAILIASLCWPLVGFLAKGGCAPAVQVGYPAKRWFEPHVAG
jgi:hypothetical protein